jgi:hypothetical protein
MIDILRPKMDIDIDIDVKDILNKYKGHKNI